MFPVNIWVSCCKDFEWHSHLKSGKTFIKLADKNVEKVHQVIHKDSQHMINNVCNILGLLYDTWQHTVFNWRLTHEVQCCKIFPSLLNKNQKQNSLSVCKVKQDQAKSTGTSFVIDRRWKLGFLLQGSMSITMPQLSQLNSPSSPHPTKGKAG